MKLLGSRLSALAVLALAGLLGGLGGGCVGYHVYPEVGNEPGVESINSPPVHQIMAESIRWTVTHYPPYERYEWQAGPEAVGDRVIRLEGKDKFFAINLPPGVRREVYEMVVKNAGPGAVAMEPGNESMPTYHFLRVWISGDEARAEVMRPVTGMPPGPDGRPVTQGMTLYLRGGVHSWRVEYHNAWSIGTMTTPSLSYIPEPPPPKAGDPGWKEPSTKTAPPPPPPSADEPAPVREDEPTGRHESTDELSDETEEPGEQMRPFP